MKQHEMERMLRKATETYTSHLKSIFGDSVKLEASIEGIKLSDIAKIAEAMPMDMDACVHTSSGLCTYHWLSEDIEGENYSLNLSTFIRNKTN